MDQDAINELCLKLYPETKDFFDNSRWSPRFGFKILNGPPLKNAPYLFIGFQPGGGEEDHQEEIEKGSEERWPKECEYANAEWRLAHQMQKIFGRELLSKCVGTNAIFLRYPNAKTYLHDIGVMRSRVESFCRGKLEQIVNAIDPQRIVAIGFSTLEQFAPTSTNLEGSKGRVLIKSGNIFGRSAKGVIHLTGARISNLDMDRIRNYFQIDSKINS